MTSRFLLTTIAAAALSACSLAPTYERPAAPVPTQFVGQTGNDDNAKAMAELDWQDFIQDARLRQVIQLALDNSRDLRSTLADVEAARAEYHIQRADQLPNVDATVSGSRARSRSSGGGSEISESWTGEAGISSFEIDLFGKLRNESKSSFESYLSTVEGARATRITLISETANAWITLAADRTRLQLARETEKSAKDTVQVTQRRMDAGVATLLDLREAQTTLHTAEYDIAELTTTVNQDIDALRLLVGTEVAPALLPDGLPDDADQWLAALPQNLPSTVLLRRPDVLEAEHLLMGANANIGAARAEFFPTISLTTAAGYASDSLSSLFSDGTRVWSFAPTVSLPIFHAGGIKGDVDYAKAQQKSYLAEYELAIQTAFQEVSDALADAQTVDARLNAQRKLVSTAQDSYRLANLLFERGADTYLNALDSQRSLYSARDTLITVRADALENRVTLYRVAGGGTATAGSNNPDGVPDQASGQATASAAPDASPASNVTPAAATAPAQTAN